MPRGAAIRAAASGRSAIHSWGARPAISTAWGSRVMSLQRKNRRGGEQRKSPRRKLGYPAKIDARNGTPLHDCILFDISHTGAKLIAQVPSEIPDEFTLLLGKTFRRCRVVWKNHRQLGVTFLPPRPA